MDWAAETRLVVCISAPHASVVSAEDLLDRRLKEAFRQLSHVSFCMVRTKDWDVKFGGGRLHNWESQYRGLLQQHDQRSLTEEWWELLDWAQILYQQGTAASQDVASGVARGTYFWTNEVDTPDGLVTTTVDLLIEVRRATQQLAHLAEIQEDLRRLLQELRIDGLRGLCVAEQDFKVVPKRLEEECQGLGFRIGGKSWAATTRAERAKYLAELGWEVSQAVRLADPSFRAALSIVRSKCTARNRATWLGFFASHPAASSAAGINAAAPVNGNSKWARGMSVGHREFTSGMRRLARVSKSVVTQAQLVTIIGMLDPLGSGFVMYGSFVEQILDTAADSTGRLTGEFETKVFTHLQRFLSRSREKDVDWFVRYSNVVEMHGRTDGTRSGRYATSEATAMSRLLGDEWMDLAGSIHPSVHRPRRTKQALTAATMNAMRFQQALQETGLFLTADEIRQMLPSLDATGAEIDAVAILEALRSTRRGNNAGFAFDELELRRQQAAAHVQRHRAEAIEDGLSAPPPVEVQSALLMLRCSVEKGTEWSINLLAGEVLTLGRGSAGMLRWDDPSVAKRHCTVEAVVRAGSNAAQPTMLCRVECLGKAKVYSEGVGYDSSVAPLVLRPGGHFFVNRVRIEVLWPGGAAQRGGGGGGGGGGQTVAGMRSQTRSQHINPGLGGRQKQKLALQDKARRSPVKSRPGKPRALSPAGRRARTPPPGRNRLLASSPPAQPQQPRQPLSPMAHHVSQPLPSPQPEAPEPEPAAITTTHEDVLAAFYAVYDPDDFTTQMIRQEINWYRTKYAEQAEVDWAEHMYSAMADLRGQDPREHFAALRPPTAQQQPRSRRKKKAERPVTPERGSAKRAFTPPGSGRTGATTSPPPPQRPRPLPQDAAEERELLLRRKSVALAEEDFEALVTIKRRLQQLDDATSVRSLGSLDFAARPATPPPVDRAAKSRLAAVDAERTESDETDQSWDDGQGSPISREASPIEGHRAVLKTGYRGTSEEEQALYQTAWALGKQTLLPGACSRGPAPGSDVATRQSSPSPTQSSRFWSGKPQGLVPAAAGKTEGLVRRGFELLDEQRAGNAFRSIATKERPRRSTVAGLYSDEEKF